MADSRDQRDAETGSYVDSTREPVFRFVGPEDALATLDDLAGELRAARAHEKDVRRYLDEAIRGAAEQVDEHGESISRDELVARSGLARQTVYNVLGHPVRRHR